MLSVRYLIFCLGFLWLASAVWQRPGPPSVDWPSYLGGPDRNQYSPLREINTDNVHRLQPVWEYHTGDADPQGRSQIQCNPLVVDGILYGTSPGFKIFALDAKSGREIWSFDPFPEEEGYSVLFVNRGVSYWKEGDDERILVAARHQLLALNAKTGQPIASFGRNGRVDIREGLGRDPEKIFVTATSPGAIYRNLIILGSKVLEEAKAAPGDIRAYDVKTGRLGWTFHTIPRPGEFGYETWPEEAWRTAGGANSWAGMSVDHRRGMVFVPTGSPAFDFYGGNRKGANLFGNTLLALDAETGVRRWHFQVVHHDLWDRDLPAPPNLVRVERDGRSLDAVAQITKSGHVFLFEREKGGLLAPVLEKPVPKSQLTGEETWPTQPLPLRPEPFSRQVFDEDIVTSVSPEARAAVLDRLKSLHYGEQFIPPSENGTVVFPGFDGGGEWGGAAWDPQTSLLYVNSSEMPWILTMVNVRDRTFSSEAEELYARHCASCHGLDMKGDGQANPAVDDLRGRISRYDLFRLFEYGSGRMPAFNHLSAAEQNALINFLYGMEQASPEEIHGPDSEQVPYIHTGWHRFLDPEGFPAVEPPWGLLTAIDLNSLEIRWQVPLGQWPGAERFGLRETGAENYGGPVVTAGGLVFIAATRDEKIRAFDKANGRLLWEYSLPAGGYATPATFRAGGRQFLVIACGGGKMGTPSADSYLAFALPRSD